MKRSAVVLLFVCALVCAAQQTPDTPLSEATLQPILTFEAPPNGDMPAGWYGGPSGTVFLDRTIFHGGQASARFERDSKSLQDFSVLTKPVEIDFQGKQVELRGFLRTQDVSDFVGLWMREDGETSGLQFDNMQNQHLNGTTDWKEYSIALPLDPQANKLFFGALLAGTGKAWVDDLQLLVDGKPIWQVPHVERPKTVIETDHEFDTGSKIAITQLSSVQIDNLYLLGKVWGFLKYHHPSVTAGTRQWDFELFRIMPAVLAAPDHTAARAAIAHWIEALGSIQPCTKCAKLDEAVVQLRPDLEWINNRALLGDDLSRALIAIHTNRVPRQQFFVSKAPNIGNPVFEHELAYPNVKLPDSGFQLLALYRLWNIVEYWSPNRDIVGEDWDGVLREFIPRIATAKDLDSYKRELFALIAKVHDGHANLWNVLDVRPPVGKCQFPVAARWIENAPVVTSVLGGDSDANTLRPGDVVTELDSVPVSKLIGDWEPYYANSNDAARKRAITQSMFRGDCSEGEIGVRRGNLDLKLKVKRVVVPPQRTPYTDDQPGPTFRLLSKDVAYLKLSSFKIADAPSYVKQANGTKGLIIDIRNYPSEFAVFALGSLLVDHETPFVRFTELDLSNPGAFNWGPELSISPQAPHYPGKIVILADEISVSQAEYTTMALRSAPGAIVVGSTTAGADGNVSPFALPGGVRTMISGLGVFYPDKRPTQQIGIVPNVVVRPTIAGIAAGRDEVLEEAVRQIVGKELPEEEVQQMSKPPEPEKN